MIFWNCIGMQEQYEGPGDVVLLEGTGRYMCNTRGRIFFADDIWPNVISRQNTVLGAEVAIVVQTKVLILYYILFVDPLLGIVALTSEVHRVWLQVLEEISDAGQIKPSEESIKVVSGHTG